MIFMKILRPVTFPGRLAVCGCLLALAASCGKQPAETVKPSPVQPSQPEPPVRVREVSASQAPAPVPGGTGSVETALLPVSNHVAVLRSRIVEAAARRGSITGQLGELRLNALSRDDEVIRSLNSEMRTMRESLLKKVGELPEAADMQKTLGAIDARRKDLMAQRSGILERKRKAGAADNQGDTAEQLKTVEANLRELQKEYQAAVSAHRKLVQQARENNAEIGALSAEIGKKEAALTERINSLPGIKELLAEQATLDATLRDLRTQLKLLESPPQRDKPATATVPAAAQ